MCKKFIMPEWSGKEQLKMSKGTAWKRNNFLGKMKCICFFKWIKYEKEIIKGMKYTYIFRKFSLDYYF